MKPLSHFNVLSLLCLRSAFALPSLKAYFELLVIDIQIDTFFKNLRSGFALICNECT